MQIMAASAEKTKKMKLSATPENADVSDNTLKVVNHERDALSTAAKAPTVVQKSKSIGVVFRELRENRGQTVQDVANILRISTHFLAAIEEMEKDKLPERVYTLGFVRSYAQYLGVDPQKSIEKFKVELYTLEYSKNTHLKMPKPVRDAERPPKKLLYVSLFMLVVTLVLAAVLLAIRSEKISEVINEMVSNGTLSKSTLNYNKNTTTTNESANADLENTDPSHIVRSTDADPTGLKAETSLSKTEASLSSHSFIDLNPHSLTDLDGESASAHGTNTDKTVQRTQETDTLSHDAQEEPQAPQEDRQGQLS